MFFVMIIRAVPARNERGNPSNDLSSERELCRCTDPSKPGHNARQSSQSLKPRDGQLCGTRERQMEAISTSHGQAACTERDQFHLQTQDTS